MIDKKIALTPIGRKFGWKKISDVDLDMLEQARADYMATIRNAHVPGHCHKRGAEAEEMVRAIDYFTTENADLLMAFAV